MANSYALRLVGLMELHYGLGVWLAGLVLLLPIAVFGIAWARRGQFYSTYATSLPRRNLYLVALVAASVSVFAYLGYWVWRICMLYRITIPFSALFVLEYALYFSRVLSIVAIICFFIGRGPYRILVILATFWVALQTWIHGGIIHWA